MWICSLHLQTVRPRAGSYNLGETDNKTQRLGLHRYKLLESALGFAGCLPVCSDRWPADAHGLLRKVAKEVHGDRSQQSLLLGEFSSS